MIRLVCMVALIKWTQVSFEGRDWVRKISLIRNVWETGNRYLTVRIIEWNSHIWLDGRDVMISRLHFISFIPSINYAIATFLLLFLSRTQLKIWYPCIHPRWSPPYPPPSLQIQPCNANHEIPFHTQFPTHHNTLSNPSPRDKTLSVFPSLWLARK